MTASRAPRIAGLLALLALACALPFVMSNFRLFQFTQVYIYAIAILGLFLFITNVQANYLAIRWAQAVTLAVAILGLNIVTGYSGQISVGHSFFFGVGAYTTMILIADHGVKDVWTIPVAALVAGAAGFLFGLPALRLSGLYLALATFAIPIALIALAGRKATAEGLLAVEPIY